MNIPENYAKRMMELLGDEYDAYVRTLDEERATSFRVNTAKCSVEEALDSMKLPNAVPVPWVEEGVYYPPEERPAKTVPWHAGMIYIQEASAMTPGSLLPIKEGDRVLDLCAAPGGKSTQIAARLHGTGVLYANDISASRAQALLKNLELSGTGRIFVTAEKPQKLMAHFPEYFDAILVDAPCSGEGMIRKDASMFHDWLSKGPAYYQPIQREILDQAKTMLRPGGYLLYSTCTFSREEDEGNIEAFLEENSDMKLVELPIREGFSQGLMTGTVRLWPHHTRGEGHFVALMQRAEDSMGSTTDRSSTVINKKPPSNERDRFPWANECSEVLEDTRIVERGNLLYAIPQGEEIHAGIHYLRTGLYLGEWKKQRFIPSQALAMVLDGRTFPHRINLPMEDPRLVRYLKGETLDVEDGEYTGEEGWILVCADRYPLGWAQRKGNRLKNKYNPAWRWM